MMKNKRGYAALFIVPSVVCIFAFAALIYERIVEIETLKAKCIKYGYAQMVSIDNKIVFKFMKELEGEKK